MAQERKTRSYVGDYGGVPTLFVNGAPFPAAAYMTYLEEYNDYASFAGAGYRLFSVPVLCAGRWINSAVDGKPFHSGIFDKKDAPDFSALDASVRRVLSACPEAYIFPRINLSAPLWWIAEHPESTDGTGKRELLFSEAYRALADKMLRTVIRHIQSSDYAPHIVGYQLAGGNTEEWFHFDLNGGYCENAIPAFNAYLDARCAGCGFTGLPDLSPLKAPGPLHNDEHLARYLEFANRAVADTIRGLCAAAKEETGGTLAVGTFYGYSLEVSSPLWGTHALRALLDCGDVDFICSPNSYIGTRAPDADWTEMYPADSVRLHGKLCLQECDVRTHLTRPLSEAAPEYDPEKRYAAPIWQPLKSKELAIGMLRKTFCRQLIRGNGFWWFDMWGGWYRDPELLMELEQMRKIYSESLARPDRKSVAEFAVFVDETAYRQMTESPLRDVPYRQREQLGRMGAPYDVYDAGDFETVYKRYKAVLFASACLTELLLRAKALCGENRVPCLAVSEAKPLFSPSELRDFCKTNGVHLYCETDDIIYVNGNYLAVHATGDGVKTVSLGGVYSYRELLTERGARGKSETLRIRMKKNETALFAVRRECER